jgi:glycosyltransferase involved in cell wall biosynthesis
MADPVAAMAPRFVRLLYLTRENFPTHRVDLEVLFARELASRGHKIDFVMQADSMRVPTGRQTWHGQNVLVGSTTLANNFLSRAGKHWLGLWHDLKSLGRASHHNYDAIQVRDKFLVAALAVVVAHLKGLKCFYWMSFPFAEADCLRAREGTARYRILTNLRGRASAWLLYRWILPHCDHAFVQSERMKMDVSARGISAQCTTPVPMGVELADLPAGELPSRAGRANQDIWIGYLGTLDRDRHLGMLIDMLAELRRGGMPARLLLVGDGSVPEDRQYLERRATEMHVLDHVVITGFLPRAEALERIRAVDVALSPFYPSPVLVSTSPTKLIEYLALKLPVVANDHPEQKLILRMSRAGVCPPWGARYFARSVRWLMRQTPHQRLQMGARGRGWVTEHRTYSRIADELERKYRDLLPVCEEP